MNNVDAIAAAIGLLILAALILIFAPLFTIWSWNQLFGWVHMFEYNFWNWLAVIGLGMFFRTTGVKTSKSK